MKHAATLTLGLATLLQGVCAAHATEFVSISEVGTILYDAPSAQAKKQFVVSRYMPFEKVSAVDDWIKVRDGKGNLFWVEKRSVSNKRYVYTTRPLVDIYASAENSSKRLFQARQHIALELMDTGSNTEWLKIRHADGEIGFVQRSDVWGD